MFLTISHIQKVYEARFSSQKTIALQDVDFSVEQGEFVAIMGESGSGKTTLLNCLATLDKPNKGAIHLNGQDLTKFSSQQSAKFRLTHLGFIFQDAKLLDTLSVKDNILLPMVLARQSKQAMDHHLNQLAKALGLSDLLDRRPTELSGGQCQRVGVARALINEPDLVLADEPTASLDFKNAQELLSLLEAINQAGQTILMVTHSAHTASHASRVLFIRDGRLFHQMHRANKPLDEFAKDISLSMQALLGDERHVLS